MTRADSDSSSVDGSPRRRGAPKGNRNAWKHGGRSAAAKAARAAACAKIVAGLPDPNGLSRALALADVALAHLNWEAQAQQNAQFPANKTNNSVGQSVKERSGDIPSNKTHNSVARAAGEGDGGIPANKTNNFVSQPVTERSGHTPPNKTNNSVAGEEALRRGAPQGNRNALKHGRRSAEWRAFDSSLIRISRQAKAIRQAAGAAAEARSER